MLGKLSAAGIVIVGALVGGCGGSSKKTAEPVAATDPAHDPAEVAKAQEQFAGLKKMCDESAEARTQRQAAKPLYERLGGRAAIKAVVTDFVAAKEASPIMKPTMAGVDKEKFIEHLTDFLSMATGGTEKYTGQDLPTSHAKLHLTDVHFMAAGTAITTILQKFKVPDPEQQEVICALVAAHDQVVLPATASK
jgi:hemoglobin